MRHSACMQSPKDQITSSPDWGSTVVLPNFFDDEDKYASMWFNCLFHTYQTVSHFAKEYPTWRLQSHPMSGYLCIYIYLGSERKRICVITRQLLLCQWASGWHGPHGSRDLAWRRWRQRRTAQSCSIFCVTCADEGRGRRMAIDEGIGSGKWCDGRNGVNTLGECNSTQLLELKATFIQHFDRGRFPRMDASTVPHDLGT
jgi:hypothetical protein